MCLDPKDRRIGNTETTGSVFAVYLCKGFPSPQNEIQINTRRDYYFELIIKQVPPSNHFFLPVIVLLEDGKQAYY